MEMLYSSLITPTVCTTAAGSGNPIGAVNKPNYVNIIAARLKSIKGRFEYMCWQLKIKSGVEHEGVSPKRSLPQNNSVAGGGGALTSLEGNVNRLQGGASDVRSDQTD